MKNCDSRAMSFGLDKCESIKEGLTLSCIEYFKILIFDGGERENSITKTLIYYIFPAEDSE